MAEIDNAARGKTLAVGGGGKYSRGMTPILRRLASALLALAAAGGAPWAHALTQARAAGHPRWWRQLQAGVDAFGGLIGVALIVAVAVVLLLVADRWIGDRSPPDDEQTRR